MCTYDLKSFAYIIITPYFPMHYFNNELMLNKASFRSSYLMLRHMLPFNIEIGTGTDTPNIILNL